MNSIISALNQYLIQNKAHTWSSSARSHRTFPRHRWPLNTRWMLHAASLFFEKSYVITNLGVHDKMDPDYCPRDHKNHGSGKQLDSFLLTISLCFPVNFSSSFNANPTWATGLSYRSAKYTPSTSFELSLGKMYSVKASGCKNSPLESCGSSS